METTVVCRICMCQESNLSDIFRPFAQEIIRMIEFCTGILLQNGKGLPSKICIKCLADLQIAHKFKLNCVDSEKAFRDWSKCNYEHIKNEPEQNQSVIKLESCMDYTDSEVREDTVIKSEGIRTNIKRSCRVSMKKNEVSEDKDQKIIVRKTKVASENKVNSRRGLNKFKRLYCELCQVAFSNRKESLEHKKKLHKEEKSWVCEVCGKSYAHRSSQIAHRHSHYPARYACHHCDYSTYNKYDLIKHVRIHTGDKLYKCKHCTASYRTSSNLRTHVRLMHEKMRAHACHICGKTYNDRATLNRHIDAHNDIKRHVCEVCHSCFRRRCHWKKHLQKQHDIIIPSCRPGPKAEILLLDKNDQVK